MFSNADAANGEFKVNSNSSNDDADILVNTGIKVTYHFDEPLADLLETQGIEDPDEKGVVCGALVALGLANYKMIGPEGTQEHRYTSTAIMKVLASEYLYSTKHWHT
jgi:hypothetical protein